MKTKDVLGNLGTMTGYIAKGMAIDKVNKKRSAYLRAKASLNSQQQTLNTIIGDSNVTWPLYVPSAEFYLDFEQRIKPALMSFQGMMFYLILPRLLVESNLDYRGGDTPRGDFGCGPMPITTDDLVISHQVVFSEGTVMSLNPPTIPSSASNFICSNYQYSKQTDSSYLLVESWFDALAYAGSVLQKSQAYETQTLGVYEKEEQTRPVYLAEYLTSNFDRAGYVFEEFGFSDIYADFTNSKLTLAYNLKSKVFTWFIQKY